MFCLLRYWNPQRLREFAAGDTNEISVPIDHDRVVRLCNIDSEQKIIRLLNKIIKYFWLNNFN